jgi:hypothetical protein
VSDLRNNQIVVRLSDSELRTVKRLAQNHQGRYADAVRALINRADEAELSVPIVLDWLRAQLVAK